MGAAVCLAQPATISGQVSPSLTVPRGQKITRALVMFYDTAHETPDQLHVSALGTATWIDEKMVAGDVVAVATPADPPRVWLGFTSDKRALHDAVDSVDRFVTTRAPTPPPSTTASNVTVLRAMTSICHSLGAVRATRILMFFSTGLPGTGADAGFDRRDTERECIAAGVSITRIDPASLKVRGGGSER